MSPLGAAIASAVLLVVAGGVPAPAHAAAPAEVQVAVLGRAIAKGELLDAADFATEARSEAAARGAVKPADAQGQEAVRNLPAGAVIRPADLIAPRLVRRGEPVTIMVRSGALKITTPGKALASGGAGDLVRVVASSTSRTLDAVVERTGTVRVVAP